MKKVYLLCVLVVCVVLSVSAQKKISILGDSYSTFRGYIEPDVNEPWYPFDYKDEQGKYQNDVRTVEQTWWRVLIDSNKDKYVL